jgi:hypothetical protein
MIGDECDCEVVGGGLVTMLCGKFERKREAGSQLMSGSLEEDIRFPCGRNDARV